MDKLHAGLAVRRDAVVVLTVLIAGCASAPSAPPSDLRLSGYEVFAGIPYNEITIGVSFAGWTHIPALQMAATGWASVRAADGGNWYVNANYQGQPGLGSAGVKLIGGTWHLQKASGTTHRGKVTSGQVQWPATSRQDIGCGMGVARFSVLLAVEGGGDGTIEGCLNDTHLDTVFPPTVWANVTLNI